MNKYTYIWVLNSGKNFPCGVFNSKEDAEVAIEKYNLNGMLTKYPINALVYDWVIEENIPDERVSNPLKQVTAKFVGNFTTAYQEHYHYGDGDPEAFNSNKMEMISMKWIIAKHFRYGMTMHGSLGGKNNQFADYIINPDCIILFSVYGFHNNRHLIKQRVLLDWLSRKYGSKQVFFLCPLCKRRVAILYNNAVAFVCKRCDKPLASYGYGLDWKNVQKDLWEYA